MKTAPVARPGASSRTRRKASTISQARRFLDSPSRPVAQKAHAIAQPTCEERQTVNVEGLRSGMRTASLSAPSGERNRYFTNPSAGSVARSRTSSRAVSRTASAAAASRRPTGRAGL
jgi:hypothetical protein